MQTHLRTRAPSSRPGYQPHPSWRWSPPPEGRQRTPLWSLSHGRVLLVTSLISPTGHWCLHLPGQQHEHLTPDKSHREHVLSSGGQFLLSSWRASKAKGRRWKCLLPVSVCFPCSKDPTRTGFEREAQPSNSTWWPGVSSSLGPPSSQCGGLSQLLTRQPPDRALQYSDRGKCLERDRVKELGESPEEVTVLPHSCTLARTHH